MIGWHITIFRTRKIQKAPLDAGGKGVDRLATWQAGAGGLAWIIELVKAGKALDLGGDGFPCRYAVRVRDVRPLVLNGPPGANSTWFKGPHDKITKAWEG